MLPLQHLLQNHLTIVKKLDKNHWIKPQIDMLVSLWQENIGVLESTRSYEI